MKICIHQYIVLYLEPKMVKAQHFQTFDDVNDIDSDTLIEGYYLED